MKRTEEQEAIMQAALHTKDNLIIMALAGAGKTSTLEMIEHETKSKPCLYLVFNTKNAREAEKRMLSTTTVRTFNSIGHRIWAKTQGRNLTVDPKKCQELLRGMIRAAPKSVQSTMWSVYWEVLAGVALAKSLGYIPNGHFLNVPRLCTQESLHDALDEKPDDLVSDLIDAVLAASIKSAYEGLVDYNDQVYMPAVFGGTFPQFPLGLVDEVQDLSPVNHALLHKLFPPKPNSRRLIAVGDPNQCHPPGTMIYVTGKGQVPIEQILMNTPVGYFSTRIGRFVGISTQGREVEACHTSYFSGDLIVIRANTKTVKVTPNHKCFVRISRDASGLLLYLMRRKNQFRVGISRIRDWDDKVGSPFGPAGRARQEKADSMWLLDIFPNLILAKAYEQYYSTEFGIPTMLFEGEQQQEGLDLFWGLIGDNLDKAKIMLEAFGRDIRHPFWSIADASFIGFHRAGVTAACNLIPDIMTMITYPDGVWHPISISREAYSGPVYGITVAQREESKRVYLANDILVHNSIYGFRGAKSRGMESLAQTYAMSPLDLSVSFRCPQAIVENARWRVPHFKWIKPGGHVERLEELPATSIPVSCTFLCRNNAPLFRLAMQLLSSGRSVQVAGSDVGPKLVAIMRKLGEDGLPRQRVLAAIAEWQADKEAKESTTAKDLADCMRVFASHGQTLSQAIAYAEHLFSQQGTIKLLTGHKAKGLEWETVFHLDPWLMRSDEQDLNLRYVVQTRSMDRYFEVDSGAIKW